VPTTLSAVTMNSADPQRTAAFWAALLDGTCHEGGNGYVHVRGGALLLIVQRSPARQAALAPDVHLDLTTDDRAHEVARAVALGASVVDERWDTHGAWTVLHDPDGREFCLA